MQDKDAFGFCSLCAYPKSSFSLLLIKGVLLKATAKKIGREINRSWRIDRQVVGRVEPLTKGVFR